MQRAPCGYSKANVANLCGAQFLEKRVIRKLQAVLVSFWKAFKPVQGVGNYPAPRVCAIKDTGGRNSSSRLGPFQQPGVADGNARTPGPAWSLSAKGNLTSGAGTEGQSAAFGPLPDQTAQAGPADTTRDKEMHSNPVATIVLQNEQTGQLKENVSGLWRARWGNASHTYRCT